MGKRSPEGKLKPWSMPIFFAKADYLVADNVGMAAPSLQRLKHKSSCTSPISKHIRRTFLLYEIRASVPLMKDWEKGNCFCKNLGMMTCTMLKQLLTKLAARSLQRFKHESSCTSPISKQVRRTFIPSPTGSLTPLFQAQKSVSSYYTHSLAQHFCEPIAINLFNAQ